MSPRALIPALLAVGVVLVVRRWFDTVEVRGRSMVPTLLPSDRLLVVRAAPRVGDVVLAPDPREPRRELVKRVAALEVSGVRLRGDNPVASTDERTFGTVPADGVRWRAVLRYWPAARIGAIEGAARLLEAADEGGEPACAFPDALVAGPQVTNR
jgi:nickel-type superoxide dismutase maturation protease